MKTHIYEVTVRPTQIRGERRYRIKAETRELAHQKASCIYAEEIAEGRLPLQVNSRIYAVDVEQAQPTLPGVV